MIKVSIDGVFAPALEKGASYDKLKALEPELASAHRELMARRGKDVGFYDVPMKTDVVRQIAEEVRRLRALADDLILLGIGGSSLGGQAITQGLAHTTERNVRALGDRLRALHHEQGGLQLR